jgi:hypothetical protein
VKPFWFTEIMLPLIYTKNEKMDKRELRQRLIIEQDMLKIMLADYVDDEETTNLILDRMNETKRLIKEIDEALDNDKNVE